MTWPCEECGGTLRAEWGPCDVCIEGEARCDACDREPATVEADHKRLCRECADAEYPMTIERYAAMYGVSAY